jgi:hypothetical protein
MNRILDIYQRIDRDTKKRFYKNIEYPIIPVSINDVYILSRVGDRLDAIAFDFYQDSDLWWIISRANPDKISGDSFFIKPGLQIRIPQNTQEIIENFKQLNK